MAQLGFQEAETTLGMTKGLYGLLEVEDERAVLGGGVAAGLVSR